MTGRGTQTNELALLSFVLLVPFVFLSSELQLKARLEEMGTADEIKSIQ